MRVKLSKGVLVGNTWHDNGSIVEVDGEQAKRLIETNSAYPVGATVETTTNPPRNSQRATAPPQR